MRGEKGKHLPSASTAGKVQLSRVAKASSSSAMHRLCPCPSQPRRASYPAHTSSPAPHHAGRPTQTPQLSPPSSPKLWH